MFEDYYDKKQESKLKRIEEEDRNVGGFKSIVKAFMGAVASPYFSGQLTTGKKRHKEPSAEIPQGRGGLRHYQKKLADMEEKGLPKAGIDRMYAAQFENAVNNMPEGGWQEKVAKEAEEAKEKLCETRDIF